MRALLSRKNGDTALHTRPRGHEQKRLADCHMHDVKGQEPLRVNFKKTRFIPQVWNDVQTFALAGLRLVNRNRSAFKGSRGSAIKRSLGQKDQSRVRV